jgi:hypothetical protein
MLLHVQGVTMYRVCWHSRTINSAQGSAPVAKYKDIHGDDPIAVLFSFYSCQHKKLTNVIKNLEIGNAKNSAYHVSRSARKQL